MSYDNPIYISHEFLLTANQADIARTIKGPSGMRGRLEEIMFNGHTTTTVGTLTVKVGSESDDDEYGTLTVANGVAVGTVKRLTADGTKPNGEESIIPADEDVEISIATAADTDDFPGDLVLTFAWW